jgi:hypothetical protein
MEVYLRGVADTSKKRSRSTLGQRNGSSTPVTDISEMLEQPV